MVPNRNGRWKCSPSLSGMTTPPQEECSYPANMHQYHATAQWGDRLVGFLDEIAQSRCRSVELSRQVVASICLEIGEVVGEQVLFGLYIVSNDSDSGLLRERKGWLYRRLLLPPADAVDISQNRSENVSQPRRFDVNVVCRYFVLISSSFCYPTCIHIFSISPATAKHSRSSKSG